MKWLVTGAAGFIGSHLVERLLNDGETVVGLDNLSTGKTANLEEVRAAVDDQAWKNFTWIQGDIENAECLPASMQGVQVVLHQAALGSVPRSIENPLATHRANVTGFLNVLEAARQHGVRRVVYASSSAVYGDSPDLPKVESNVGRCLSPYASSKRCNEIYAEAYAAAYGMELIGLRYFNVFGPRQDPNGAYAAVIPRWINALLQGKPITIYGDGETSRDFCYVANVVQANLLAGRTSNSEAINQVYNIAVHAHTTLNHLFIILRERLQALMHLDSNMESIYESYRLGDIRHSFAEISKAQRLLNYHPTHSIIQGLDATLPWYQPQFLRGEPK
jgi:UDP-N-acetylglucosamine/UDP-N-acetylgalactosamine 4-epimerase